MLGRRNFLGTVGSAVVVLGVEKTVDGSSENPPAEPAREGVLGGEQASVDTLFGHTGVRPRTRFGTCEVLSLEKRPDGGVGVWFADSKGQPFAVELLGYDAERPGVARAGSLGVYMNNKGNGRAATVEEHGLAAMALADHLARSEAAGATLPPLPRLSERRTAAV